MAGGVNKVILVGNLGKDPEVRYIQTGNAVCTLRLACTERRKDGDSGWKDHTEWMDVVVWGKNAENAGQYLAKGRQIYVEGRLQTRQYKDKDGNDRYKTEVVAFTVLYLGSKDASTETAAARGGSSSGRGVNAPPKKPAAPTSSPADDDAPPPEWEDDLPF